MTPGRYLAATLAALTTIGGIAWVDVNTGPDVGFSLFYLVPVVVTGWKVGRRSAAAAAVMASLAWFVADYALRPDDRLWVSLWNGLTRFAIYFAIGWLTSTLRLDRDRLSQLNLRLAASLGREETLSRTDGLTGLANSRSFLETVRRELERARRGGTPLCVAYLDLDHFKRVNDTLGHLRGDELLREVAAAIRHEIRGGDVPARLGGDEFAILLWDVTPEGVQEIGERLVARIRRLGESFPQVGLGATAGIAYFRHPPDNAEAVLREADTAMYRAKAGGKNRTLLVQPGASAIRAPELATR
ncbi:MAG: GGDEF domain-containing protein [Myxococcota bacterium]|nr:GGDEF domain-containing protein [Myxococcota bacterium]